MCLPSSTGLSRPLQFEVRDFQIQWGQEEEEEEAAQFAGRLFVPLLSAPDCAERPQWKGMRASSACLSPLTPPGPFIGRRRRRRRLNGRARNSQPNSELQSGGRNAIFLAPATRLPVCSAPHLASAGLRASWPLGGEAREMNRQWGPTEQSATIGAASRGESSGGPPGRSNHQQRRRRARTKSRSPFSWGR